MDKNEVINKVSNYANLVIQNMSNVENIVLYGSYARGNAKEHSDIDVAIVVNKFKKNIFKTEPLLWKLTRDIDFRIEPIIIEKDNDPVGFLPEIMKYGIVVYSKDNY